MWPSCDITVSWPVETILFLSRTGPMRSALKRWTKAGTPVVAVVLNGNSSRCGRSAG
jgi:hypothetical protein